FFLLIPPGGGSLRGGGGGARPPPRAGGGGGGGAGGAPPPRDPVTGYRVYAEADLRDARLAHQLRRGGHSLKGIATVLEQVRTAGGPEPLEATLRDWHDRVGARGLAMLTGAAELAAYLREEPGKATA
ncbi:MerR family transcriptional regulator, partial [Streptomyces olivaceus]|uniref:MerR family transcriptional regulator n=1 Tax=Streptomyces olivaceus TaxID=47716 RepID=UPI0036A6523B